jgi:murein L,D-transpeptidase YcbB/YkuD
LYNDILPEVKKDIGYLAKKKMNIFKGYGSDMVEIDPTTIDWSTVSRGNFPYTIRQDPGAVNALGKVKFMFPNKYNVYIHDTPSKELFNRPERTFSSGCIRLKNPMTLLEYLIRDDPNLNMEKVKKILESGKEQTIILKDPITVYIQYLTCWADGDEIDFRKDIYNRDPDVLSALEEQAPNL